ncbi:MAG: hypothetical protein M1839_004033 [Geoglossum umbratile]|nr:MAG: hypothetical protein M1839_004033 [Geoglossum umbratile]
MNLKETITQQITIIANQNRIIDSFRADLAEIKSEQQSLKNGARTSTESGSDLQDIDDPESFYRQFSNLLTLGGDIEIEEEKARAFNASFERVREIYASLTQDRMSAHVILLQLEPRDCQ